MSILMHDSDCALHNEPAMPADQCDCTAPKVVSPSKKRQQSKGLFVVWSPNGETAPKVSFTTHGQACLAMHKMAKKHPGQTFMVMGKMGKLACYPAPDLASGEQS